MRHSPSCSSLASHRTRSQRMVELCLRCWSACCAYHIWRRRCRLRDGTSFARSCSTFYECPTGIWASLLESMAPIVVDTRSVVSILILRHKLSIYKSNPICTAPRAPDRRPVPDGWPVPDVWLDLCVCFYVLIYVCVNIYIHINMFILFWFL